MDAFRTAVYAAVIRKARETVAMAARTASDFDGLSILNTENLSLIQSVLETADRWARELVLFHPPDR
jgi:hypothetical protein